MEFKASEPLSVGVELEFQLLNAKTLDLANGIIPLMELYPESPFVKPEFIQNTVEIVSKICSTLSELEDHLNSLAAELKSRCNTLGMTLCGAGSHPFDTRLAIITPFKRYLQMEKMAGHLAYTQITYATHVHLGMPSGEKAIIVMRELRRYLPLLIALSASSPFWRGYDTGYASYRHRILAASRSYGIPPMFKHWADFINFINAMRRARAFNHVDDIHWDIRPRPHLGTLEVRIMDAQATVGRTVALAGFVRALAHYLVTECSAEDSKPLGKPLPWWIDKENHFQASRLGLAANYIQDEQGTVRPLKDVYFEVIEAVTPSARELGQISYLERFHKGIMEGLSYQRQRKVFESTRSFIEVVVSLVEELEEDLSFTNTGKTKSLSATEMSPVSIE